MGNSEPVQETVEGKNGVSSQSSVKAPKGTVMRRVTIRVANRENIGKTQKQVSSLARAQFQKEI